MKKDFEKYYLTALFVLNTGVSDIHSIEIGDLDEGETYAILLNLNNMGLVSLTKRHVSISDRGKLHLKKHLLELESAFIEFIKAKRNDISKRVNITGFMVSNFVKPDPRSDKTSNDNDFGVYFVKRLKTLNLIDYDGETLEHVNFWFVDGGESPKIKRWFDTLDKPLYVELKDAFWDSLDTKAPNALDYVELGLPQNHGKNDNEIFVFVSHSNLDKKLVTLFIDKILKLTLKIDSAAIFCTSLHENTIKTGLDFRQAIRENLINSTLVIQIISDNYRNSEVCLNEMGAAWVLSNRVVPFIMPPINYKSVGFIHEPNQLLKLNDKQDIIKFIEEQKKDSNKVSVNEIVRQVEDFIESVNAINDQSQNITAKPSPHKVSNNNELGLEENDIIKIENRDGLYLFKDDKLIHIIADDKMSLFIYGFDGEKKNLKYSDASRMIDPTVFIPPLRECEILSDKSTNKMWMLINDERRFLPTQTYKILFRHESVKVTSVTHSELIKYPEGDTLKDTKDHFV